MLLEKDKLMEEIDNIPHEEILRRDKRAKKVELNIKRDDELKGFIIDNIFLNKEIIKDMAVKHATLENDEKAHWIAIDNKTVELTKAELGALVKTATNKVEAIYFKYRQLKDDLEDEA